MGEGWGEGDINFYHCDNYANARFKIKNRYKIIGLLGDGGMSTVYKAERIADRRRFAIKEVKDGFVDTSEKDTGLKPV